MAEKGKLELLEFLRGKGCPWDEWTCEFAALNGHLECLKYAREKWMSLECSDLFAGCQKGHLDCLKYAHENGCPWDEGLVDMLPGMVTSSV